MSDYGPSSRKCPHCGEAIPVDLPRRIQLKHSTPAELAIRAAVDAVEVMGADVRLTQAVVLLDQAREKVADFVDDVRPGSPPSGGGAADPELQKLREENAQLRAVAHFVDSHLCPECVNRIAVKSFEFDAQWRALRALPGDRDTPLEKALRVLALDYADHLPLCRAYDPEPAGECDCGFLGALDAFDAVDRGALRHPEAGGER